jgi:hypothetical protein
LIQLYIVLHIGYVACICVTSTIGIEEDIMVRLGYTCST